MVGCLLSNELFDALPVHRLVGQPDGLAELWVRREAGRLGWVLGPLARSAPRETLAAAGVVLAPGQIADVAPAAAEVYREMCRRLARGFLLTIDYGGEAAEVYGRDRMAGTLLAYRGHRAVDDPLAAPGEQDLTAHVDVTTLRRVGEAAGLTTVADLTQRAFLLGLGLRDWLDRLDRGQLSPADYFNARQGASELIRPERLGRFRVLLQARDVAVVPAALSGG